MVDSGATNSFVAAHWVKQQELDAEPLPEMATVVLADGTTTAHTEQLNEASLSIGEADYSHTFEIMKLENYDAILGRTWLAQAKPDID